MKIKNIQQQIINLLFYIPKKIYNIYVLYILWFTFICIVFFNAGVGYTVINIIIFIWGIYLLLITAFLFFYRLDLIISPHDCFIFWGFSIVYQFYFITDINHICYKNWVLLIEDNFPLDNTFFIAGFILLFYMFYISYTLNKISVIKNSPINYTTSFTWIDKIFDFMVSRMYTEKEYLEIKTDYENIQEYIKNIRLYSSEIIIYTEPSLKYLYLFAIIFGATNIICIIINASFVIESMFFSIHVLYFHKFIVFMVFFYIAVREYSFKNLSFSRIKLPVIIRKGTFSTIAGAIFQKGSFIPIFSGGLATGALVLKLITSTEEMDSKWFGGEIKSNFGDLITHGCAFRDSQEKNLNKYFNQNLTREVIVSSYQSLLEKKIKKGFVTEEEVFECREKSQEVTKKVAKVHYETNLAISIGKYKNDRRLGAGELKLGAFPTFYEFVGLNFVDAQSSKTITISKVMKIINTSSVLLLTEERAKFLNSINLNDCDSHSKHFKDLYTHGVIPGRVIDNAWKQVEKVVEAENSRHKTFVEDFASKELAIALEHNKSKNANIDLDKYIIIIDRTKKVPEVNWYGEKKIFEFGQFDEDNGGKNSDPNSFPFLAVP